MKKLFATVPFGLIIVTLIAGALRLPALAKYPVGFHIDEASLGYNGYSMLKTGKDEHGNRLPLYIDMFGDNRPTGYHYLTIVPIAIFGVNEFATRFPGAIFGLLSVIPMFYLALIISKDKRTAFVASALMAISPWHIVSSRASAESIVALFFILLGATLLIVSIRSASVLPLTVGSLCLTLSFFFYHTPRMFVPILFAGVAALFWKQRHNYPVTFRFVAIMCGLIITCTSCLLIFVIQGGTGRFGQVSIFGSPATTLILEEQLREDGFRQTNPLLSRILHNKPINYSLTFLSNYFEYFTGEFLFLKGGRPLWYKVPNMGLLYLVELPCIVVGLLFLFAQRDAFSKVPLMWVCIAPLAASMTTDDIPNVQRVMVMFPMCELIAGYGIIRIISSSAAHRKNIIIACLTMAFVFNGIYFFHQYLVHGSSHETIYRFNGFKEMVQAVAREYDAYDKIIMTKTSGGIYPHVLFFTKYNPATYQQEGSPKDPDFGGFGKYVFTPQFCPSTSGDDRLLPFKNVLFVDSGTCKESPRVRQKKILREDGTTAFILVYPD